MQEIRRRLMKPEYLLRPGQMFRRLGRGRFGVFPQSVAVDLPWGLPLEVAPRETIGGGIWRLGIHELIVSEVLWRLIDPGETVADVGANCGYFTSLMVARVGKRGVVWAIEPHPEMRQRLIKNIGSWRGRIAEKNVAVCESALSDLDGFAHLCQPPGFEINTGTAYIRDTPSSQIEETSLRVELRRLDTLFAQNNAPAVLKLDVEGHEMRVLSGAGELLSRDGIRDILLEEHNPYPSDSMRLLERRGYFLYKLDRAFLRPLLQKPDAPPRAGAWDAPNYLATLDPERAQARLCKTGWRCLSVGSATA